MSWVTGESFPHYLRSFERNLFTRQRSTFKHRWINWITYLINYIWKFPKASPAAQNAFAGNMRPAGHVFETPGLEYVSVEIFLFNKTRLGVHCRDYLLQRLRAAVSLVHAHFLLNLDQETYYQWWSLGLQTRFSESRSWRSRLETLLRSFFMKFCKKEFLQKTF